MGYNAITHLFDHPLYTPNDFTCTKVCDCMLTNSYTHHDAAQEHLLYIPPKVYSLMVLIVLYQKLAVWMVNNVDYLNNQGKTNSNIYVETYTQFHVQKLPEHDNYTTNNICALLVLMVTCFKSCGGGSYNQDRESC